MIYVALPDSWKMGHSRTVFEAMLDDMVGVHQWYWAVERHGEQEWEQWISEEGILFRNAVDAVAFRLKTGL